MKEEETVLHCLGKLAWKPRHISKATRLKHTSFKLTFQVVMLKLHLLRQGWSVQDVATSNLRMSNQKHIEALTRRRRRVLLLI